MIFVNGSTRYPKRTNYTMSMVGSLMEMMNQRRFTRFVRIKLFTAMTQGGI